jgi:hypothetical protein
MNQRVTHAKDELRAIVEVTPELQDIVAHDFDWKVDSVWPQFSQQVIAEVYCDDTKTCFSEWNGMTARATAKVNGERA